MTPGEQYRFGPFHLDVTERELRRDGAAVALTAKTFDLLLILVQGAGRTFTKSELLESLWPGSVVEESNLSQTIFLLRKSLGQNGEGSDYIATVPRRGYKFVASVSLQLLGDNRFAPSPSRVTRARWVWPAITALAVAAAIWFALLWARERPPLNLSAYRFRPFAYTQGHEAHAVWSPDGKSVAFLQGQYVLNLSGLGPRRLMVQPSDGGSATPLLELEQVLNCCSDLAWSPDGARIYFASPGGIYSVSRAGGQPEPVLSLKEDNALFDFGLSPDGRVLAIWRARTTADGKVRGSVWISSPPGAEPREYTPAPFAVLGGLGPQFLRFSPDGRLLLVSFLTFSGNVAETWLLPIPAGSGMPRRIFRRVPWVNPPTASWMPDGRRLVLSGNVAPIHKPALWFADIRDESLTRLTDGTGQQEDPAVSPDGRRLLFTRVEEDADIMELPLDGSSPRKLLATGATEYSPAWSPKGGEFAYLTRRNGNDELWLRSSQGEWERPLATAKEFPALFFLSKPAISPDGSRVAYSVVLRDPNQPLGSLYISPTAGGTPTWIANGGGASWSPDGESIAFRWLKPSGALALATVRVGSSQQPFEIPDVACSVPVWSPSGEWIACNTPGGTTLVSPDGKIKRTLPPLRVPAVWSKDSQTLYALQGENGISRLVAEDVRSGAIRKVADYGAELTPYSGGYDAARALSLSPDGKSLAVGTLKKQTDLWILEGFPQ